jgi:type VI secretion system protein ImpH
MASTSGQTPNSLIDELAKRPFAFDFYQAVRLLQAQYSDFPRIGYSQSVAQDPFRFAQKPTLAFPPATLEGVTQGAHQSVPRLWTTFFGLFGPNGPLPLHLTEYARERELHSGDRTLSAFLNVFHHRLISFFFRAWADSQKTLDLDRPDDQRFAVYLGSFFGLGQAPLQNRDAVPDHPKLYFSGRLAAQTRNAEGLEAILGDYFGVPTEVQTFVGRWMPLPADSCCRLGESPETGRLGVNSLVGSRIWECQLNMRIKLGPMRLADFERMLPSAPAFKRLRYWVLNYAGDEYFWDLQLVLRREDVPETHLGQFGRLGWTTWLKTQPFTRDADGLVIIPPEASN